MGIASIVSGFLPNWRAFIAPTLVCCVFSTPSLANPADWLREFPKTDFTKTSIKYKEIRSDGTTRDAIPPINNPVYKPASDIKDIGPLEPVISIEINGDARAYPLRILLWHEIVNDVVGGVPVLISYCPLCNSSVVYNRVVDGETLTFGNTGRLRHFDLVMYDKETESWWQQFSGDAIIGEMTGTRLTAIPSRLESFELFRGGAPDGRVLVPGDPKARQYGTTPFVRMDSRDDAASRFPAYDLPKGVLPLERVVVVDDQAWPLKVLAEKRRIVTNDLILSWSEGQNSIHDMRWIPFGRDVGNVTVERYMGVKRQDAVYDVTFAFVFAAFRPEGVWHTE